MTFSETTLFNDKFSVNCDEIVLSQINGFLQCRGGSIATSITVKGSGLFLTHLWKNTGRQTPVRIIF
jgi:hypothetical protein